MNKSMFDAVAYSSDTVLFGGMGHVSVKYSLARRVRTVQRQLEGVKACGG
jgi:hypothetical protein